MSHRRVGQLPKMNRERFKTTQAALGLVGIKISQNDFVDWDEDQVRQATRWAKAFGEDPKTRIPRPEFVPAPDMVRGWR